MGNDFSGSRHLQLTWLPTSTSEARTIERDDLGVRMRDFAIDPSQDLMALVVAGDIARYVTFHSAKASTAPRERDRCQIPFLLPPTPRRRSCCHVASLLPSGLTAF